MLAFSKMHGIGNDFIVLDRRASDGADLDAARVRRLADRHTGIGCDQLLSIETASTPGAAFAYGIWNQDGSPARQCGNGVRCVVAWLARAGLIGPGALRLQSPSGPVDCELLDSGWVRVAMAVPDFDPAALPFIAEAEANSYPLRVEGEDIDITVVSIGNPHAVVRVDAVARAPVQRLGALIEAHPRFPERVNVGFVEIVSREQLFLRVFERGVGETLACGTGACAAAVVGMRLGVLDRRAWVSLPGGELLIEWPAPDQPVWMSGPAAFVFEGEFHEQ